MKNDTYLVYDENYNFNKLFNELITQMNIKKSSALIPLFDMLKVSDPTNPYLMKIEKDFVSNANRKYPFHFTPSLAKIRFNEIDMFLKSKNRDFNKIELNGIVRFLFENCKLERFNYYINEFLKMQNLPLNFIWQCEDALFNNFAEDKKISILEKLLFENRYCVKSIGLYLREQLFLFRGVEEFRELNSLNEKIAKSCIIILLGVKLIILSTYRSKCINFKCT